MSLLLLTQRYRYPFSMISFKLSSWQCMHPSSPQHCAPQVCFDSFSIIADKVLLSAILPSKMEEYFISPSTLSTKASTTSLAIAAQLSGIRMFAYGALEIHNSKMVKTVHLLGFEIFTTNLCPLHQ